MIKPPTRPTLVKYGLTVDAWLEMARRYDGACWLCRKVPATGRLVIDHEHVKGYSKLPPEERARRVRGLLCWLDNHLRVAKNDLTTARRVVDYLAEYEVRRPADYEKPKKRRAA